jgi:hypothetical protein
MAGWLIVVSYQKEIWHGILIGIIVLLLEVPWICGAKGKYDDKHKGEKK